MKRNQIQIRDPYILRDDRTKSYFMYGTTDKDCWDKAPGVGFDTYRSSDLENWEGPFKAFVPPEGFWGKHNFWAPEVYFFKDAYYMLASFIGEKSEGSMRGTQILRSEKPEGPFVPWSDGAVTPKDWMCLDGTLFIDDEEKPWMVFCHEWVQIADGTVCAIRLSEDLKCAEGEPVLLFAGSDAVWSKPFENQRIEGECHVTDGCNIYRHTNGSLVMQWSTVGYEGYCIGYAVSESGSILGPWKQSENLLFKKDGGHGMIFTTFEGRMLISLHQPNKTPDERPVFFELEETAEGIRIKE